MSGAKNARIKGACAKTDLTMSQEIPALKPKQAVQEYISAEEYAKYVGQVDENTPNGGIIVKEVNRLSITRAIMDVFQLIGGVPRFAQWAGHEDNQTEFYKMWAKQAPNANHDVQSEKPKTIIHVIPRSALDD